MSRRSAAECVAAYGTPMPFRQIQPTEGLAHNQIQPQEKLVGGRDYFDSISETNLMMATQLDYQTTQLSLARKECQEHQAEVTRLLGLLSTKDRIIASMNETMKQLKAKLIENDEDKKLLQQKLDDLHAEYIFVQNTLNFD